METSKARWEGTVLQRNSGTPKLTSGAGGEGLKTLRGKREGVIHKAARYKRRGERGLTEEGLRWPLRRGGNGEEGSKVAGEAAPGEETPT